MTMITWVPSKKAVELGFPAGVNPLVDYNIDDAAIPDATKVVMLTRALRHMYNNEATSAKIAAEDVAAKEAKEKGVASTFDAVTFLDKWRRDQMAKILAGELGMRAASAEPVLDPVDREAQDRCFDVIREFVLSKGGVFNYTVRNARSLAWKDADGNTMQDLIDLLLTKKRGKAIYAQAVETVAARQASAAVNEDEDIFGEDDEDEAAE
jgi:hypothetical protein